MYGVKLDRFEGILGIPKVTVGQSNILLPIMDSTAKWETEEETEELNNTINQ